MKRGVKVNSKVVPSQAVLPSVEMGNKGAGRVRVSRVLIGLVNFEMSV